MAVWPFNLEPVAGSPPDTSFNTTFPEKQLKLPWTLNPAASWLDYRCWVEVFLDAGMALHKPLPSSDPAPDDLGQSDIFNPSGDSLKVGSGVNVTPTARYADVIQRMATPTYTFLLKGTALRAGYQVPIPKLVSVAGADAVPGRIQAAYNVIVGNLSGIPLWYAQWEKHYMVTNLPTSQGNQAPVPFNPALHIRPDAQLPQTVQVPWTQPDQRHAYGAQGQPILTGSPVQRPR